MNTVNGKAWLAQIALLEMIAALGRRLHGATRRGLKDTRGQTPTEYLMIVGLMAVVIVVVFVAYYWKEMQSAASEWVGNVQQSVTGAQIKPK